MARLLFIVLAIVLSGCAGSAPREARPMTSVPATRLAIAPCVSGARPGRIVPLKELIAAEEWAALALSQATQLVAAQALKYQNRSDDLDAATGGCP